MEGNGGRDTVDYSLAVGGVAAVLDGDTFVSVSVNGTAKDTLAGIENIIGTAFIDNVVGDARDNSFRGGLSDKTDSVRVTLSGAAPVTVSVGGVDEDTLNNVENVVGGSAADMLIGDGGANLLFGAGNNDMLKGGAGKDRLDGGAGIDTADFSDRSQSIVLKLNKAELVTVKVGVSSEDSIRNVEDIVAGSKADTLTGDTLGNRLSGNGGTDKLDGAGGEDVLIGGAGKDLLTGGGGADTFIFLKVSDSAGNQLDTVTDFNLKQKDVIDLSAIDAKESTGADDAFHFLATQNTAFHKAGDLHWFFKDKTTVIEGDTDGNHKADFSIVLQGHVVLTEASFDL